jgi:mono/diheme cytochrome c family protein
VSATLRLLATGTLAIVAVGAALLWSDGGGDSSTTAASSASGIQAGRAVFEAKGCVVCHEEARVGPDLTGLGDRAADRVDGLDAEQYIRQSVREPQAYIAGGGSGAQMPTLKMSDDELDALTQYLLAR